MKYVVSITRKKKKKEEKRKKRNNRAPLESFANDYVLI